MKKYIFLICAVILAVILALPGKETKAAETAGTESQDLIAEFLNMDFSGKTVILHTNDTHGEIEGYAYVKAARTLLEAKGAEVITVDSGDYSLGSIYVSFDGGKSAVTMMKAAAYDIVTIGNHEFDFGYKALRKKLDKSGIKVVCANVLNSKGKSVFEEKTVWTGESGLKIGFFGLDTPEAMTKAHPSKLKGLKIARGEELYKIAQDQVDALKEESDIVVCLAHLGIEDKVIPNTSIDVYNNTTGIDIILDGNSHSVMTEGSNGEPIQSTGQKFENFGAVVIDNASKQIVIKMLIPMEKAKELLTPDAYAAKKAKKIIKKVDRKYGEVFASSEVKLNGERTPGNRTEETNLGDLITDAMIWEVTKNADGLLVDNEHVIALVNGGSIRASIEPGDITMNDIKTSFPYISTVSVVYVRGSELLEALEASTYCTPDENGGFPQASGIKYTVNTKKSYKKGEQYPDSSYFAPKKIRRVTIESINGKPFNKSDVYAVVTNDFCASGGDTYYIFKKASAQFDTGIILNEALTEYINVALNGNIGQEYAAPRGRITIK